MRLALFTAMLCLAITAPANAQESQKPNIVFFMADDMGMGDTSAYQDLTGNADDVQVSTPAMELLARMGVRFSDAHTPASRCSGTRYGLLTGRYPWRNRLKHWVLFGVQGDPMIERDRPTIATLLRDNGYRTAMVGKWHVGLRYRRSDGKPADGWKDADLSQPLYDTPLDHGFDYCRFTSRSHGTSGPSKGGRKSANDARQSVGPGHIHGRVVMAASGDGKRLVENHADSYVLTKLGSRHSDHAIEFVHEHVAGAETSRKPFFLYYPSNSNHGPYTPDDEIAGKKVAGASRSKAEVGHGGNTSMGPRYDFVYENDVALGRLMEYLSTTDDPRAPGQKLIRNTVVVFTSDNGAERKDKVCTGPFRSNKGSVYEGGHRVPFIVSWPAGGVGDGDEETVGQTNASVIGLQDMFATFADIVGCSMPNLASGQKGGEDSASVLRAWRGEPMGCHPIFFNDHSESKKDHALLAYRKDNPTVRGHVVPGMWKIFFRPAILRASEAVPYELYDLKSDPMEEHNRIDDPTLAGLVSQLKVEALKHRMAGGHRAVEIASDERIVFDWSEGSTGDDVMCVAEQFLGQPSEGVIVKKGELEMSVSGATLDSKIGSQFDVNARGLGISGGRFKQVDEGEAVLIRFNRDVLIESAAIVAGNGVCGGFYRIEEEAPLAIYCVDGGIDANDQSGLLSDIGVVKAGETLRFDSSAHYGTEAPGRWRLQGLSVRLMK